MTPVQLPEVPEPFIELITHAVYDAWAAQLREYATAAVLADRERVEALAKNTPQPAGGEAVAPFAWFATDDDGRYGIGADRDGAVRDLGGLPEAVSRVLPLYTTPPAAQKSRCQRGLAAALQHRGDSRGGEG